MIIECWYGRLYQRHFDELDGVKFSFVELITPHQPCITWKEIEQWSNYGSSDDMFHSVIQMITPLGLLWFCSSLTVMAAGWMFLALMKKRVNKFSRSGQADVG